LVYGLGFPPFKGGLFRWIDSIGINTLCDMASRFSELGELYQATESMASLAAAKGSYYSVQKRSV